MKPAKQRENIDFHEKGMTSNIVKIRKVMFVPNRTEQCPEYDCPNHFVCTGKQESPEEECPLCAGDGDIMALDGINVINCPQCRGTGKISSEAQAVRKDIVRARSKDDSNMENGQASGDNAPHGFKSHISSQDSLNPNTNPNQISSKLVVNPEPLHTTNVFTLKKLRELDLSIDCPKIEGLPDVIDPTKYYNYIITLYDTKWIRIEDVKSAVEYLKGSIAEDKRFDDKDFFWINQLIDKAFPDITNKEAR